MHQAEVGDEDEGASTKLQGQAAVKPFMQGSGVAANQTEEYCDVVQRIAITSERREVPAVLAARASPAMGLEVQEVRPTETPRQTGTVDLQATTVPPTVVALRP